MRVISNTAISLDGKITDHLGSRIMLGSDLDRKNMRRLRRMADAVLVGGETFRTWSRPMMDGPEPRNPPLINAVLTRRGVLGGETRFPDERVRLMIFGGPDIDRSGHETHLGATVLSTDDPHPAWALRQLKELGCSVVLVEGGGGLLGPMLMDDLVDELFVTLCPKLIGGRDAPTLFDGKGLQKGHFLNLTLRSCEQQGDELFLHYARTSVAF